MPESVFDTSFIAMANGPLAAEKEGNLLHKRLTAMRRVTSGERIVRYNKKLLTEYMALIKERRNDIIEQFFELLDSDRAMLVKTSTLRKADKANANKCKWPTHDQHVLAAAVGGTEVVIYVTENALGRCGVMIKRTFGFTVHHLA